MNVIKLLKEITSDTIHVKGLSKYKGKSAEIIILIEEQTVDNKKIRQKKAFDIIKQCSGEITPWKREDIYER